MVQCRVDTVTAQNLILCSILHAFKNWGSTEFRFLKWYCFLRIQIILIIFYFFISLLSWLKTKQLDLKHKIPSSKLNSWRFSVKDLVKSFEFWSTVNLHLTGTVDKQLALSLKLHIALFLSVTCRHSQKKKWCQWLDESLEDFFRWCELIIPACQSLFVFSHLFFSFLVQLKKKKWMLLL